MEKESERTFSLALSGDVAVKKFELTRADLYKAQDDLGDAEDDLDRAKDDLSDAKDLDRAKTDLDDANVDLDKAKPDLRDAERGKDLHRLVRGTLVLQLDANNRFDE